MSQGSAPLAQCYSSQVNVSILALTDGHFPHPPLFFIEISGTHLKKHHQTSFLVSVSPVKQVVHYMFFVVVVTF